MPRKFDHGKLHAKADAEIRDALFARKLNRGNFSFHTPAAKATWNQNRIKSRQGPRALPL